MVHWDLKSAGAVAVHQQRQETMEAVERKKAIQHRTSKGADGATGVAKVRLQHSFARPAGDLRGGAPHEVVLAGQPHAAHKIHSVQLREKARKVRRVVLQVAIQRGDNRADGVLENRPKSGALAAVSSV